ncbi:APC family permease [Lactobacillus sp. 23-2]|uniref:APC family permease n=1 Tax=Lactobacillus sp. 23-2 TaxID=2981842 RepID=UPI00383586E9
MIEEKKHKNYMSWLTLAMLDYVTIIGFEDIFFPFQNQGLSVVISWLFLLATYIIPYEMIVTQLGLTFKENEAGGLASWIRRGTGSDALGYATSWMYWAQTIPYLVDVSNSVIVAISWLILGNNTLSQHMSTFTFGLLTFVIILLFLVFENSYRKALDIMSLIGGIAMFSMSFIFVLLVAWALTHGAHMATPLTWSNLKPSFSLHYFSTTGLLIFAMSGAELAAPYVSRLKHPVRDFPKSMWALVFMTAFMTIFQTLGLAALFDTHNIPKDFKMNGSYYAFQILGREAGMGNTLMYVFAAVQLFFMLAQLAALVDAASRVFASDTASEYMPKWILKKNKSGRPVHSYMLTAGIALFLLLLSGTLPEINDIFNWLLNLNGIVSPYKTSVVFIAFLAIRYQQDKFKSDFVFIKNKKGALAVGWWCFLFTFACATMGFLPQEAQFGTQAWTNQLWMNIFSVLVLFGTGFLLPWLRKLEMKREAAAEVLSD